MEVKAAVVRLQTAARGGRSVYSVISVRYIRCLGTSGFRKVRTEV
jgi:hypothetical protein